MAAERVPAVTAKDEARAECSMWISHFSQVLQLWNRRELHDEGILKFYSTNMLNKPSLSLRTDDDVLFWGERVLEGEKKRVDAGGICMENPSAEAFAEMKIALHRENTTTQRPMSHLQPMKNLQE